MCIVVESYQLIFFSFRFRPTQVEALDQELDDYVVVDRATLEASWLTKDQRKGTKTGEGNEISGDRLKDDQSAPTEEGDGDTVLDPLLPPLHRLFLSSVGDSLLEEKPDPQEQHSALKVKPAHGFKQDSVLLVAELDTANPLTEAKWVRTGDVDSWISQMTGRIFKPEEKAECGWRRKITVVDPDPVSTSFLFILSIKSSRSQMVQYLTCPS